MWLVSYVGDGDILKGKRLWLRPGTSCLFGRTSSKPPAGERCFYIEDTRISRKHVTLRTATSSPDGSTRLQDRTILTITDGSKKGTIINGEKTVQDQKQVDGSKGSYRVELGETGHAFKLEWKEVVLTFSGISAKAKQAGTALAKEKQKLEGCDIKLSTEYATNKTSHVVAKKRNTPSGLHALVEAKWLVADSWVEALSQVVKKTGPNDTSPLEEDFDGNWPAEADYVAPAGNEPNPRPNEYLKPDAERAQVFADYIFVFLSQAQYESLMPVISGGGGKAVLMDYRLETTVDDFVNYARALVGQKGNGQFLPSQESGPGGLVTVRLGDKDEKREGSEPFMEKLSFTLNQRTIEQNELLDAILIKDASSFRHPLRDLTQPVSQEPSRPSGGTADSSSFPRPPQISQRQTGDSPPAESRRGALPEQRPQENQEQMADQAAEEPPPARRRNRRMITQPRKIDFDDFDPSRFAPTAQEPDAPSHEPSQAASVQAMDVDHPTEQVSQRATQKRPAEEELVKEEEIDENLYPALAALKRRKIAEAAKRCRTSKPLSPEPEVVAEKPVKGKNGKVKKEPEIDIRADMKKRRKEEEEARRKDEEALEEALNTDLEKMKVNVKIEQFDPPSAPPVREVDSTTSQNPAWNGRPNFKKFRSNKLPRDHGDSANPETQRVLISLVEVPTRSQGLGDEYWLETGRDNERRAGNKSQNRSLRISQASANMASGSAGNRDDDSEEDDSTAFRRRLQRSREEDRDEQVISGQLNPGQTQTQGRGGKKRGALEALLGEKPAPAKKPRAAAGKAAASKAKNVPTVNIDDDDEDDSVAFRRRRF